MRIHRILEQNSPDRLLPTRLPSFRSAEEVLSIPSNKCNVCGGRINGHHGPHKSPCAWPRTLLAAKEARAAGNLGLVATGQSGDAGTPSQYIRLKLSLGNTVAPKFSHVRGR